MNKFLSVPVVVFSALAIAPLAAAETIRGRVIEGGAPGAVDVGIGQVIVRILDAGGKPLGSTLTNNNGHYSVQVPVGASKATFDKFDYTPQPARRTIHLDRSTQDDVLLGKKNQPPTYYQALAKAFNQSDRQKATQYAEIVDALPGRDKELVVKSLSSDEAMTALSQIEIQRQYAQIRQQKAASVAGAVVGGTVRPSAGSAAGAAAAAILREQSIRSQNQVRDTGAARAQ